MTKCPSGFVILYAAMTATIARTKTEPSHWDRLKQERVLLSIPEFCSVLGWHRSKYYRHKNSIRVVEGYGNPMIPIGEVSKILGEPQPDANQ